MAMGPPVALFVLLTVSGELSASATTATAAAGGGGTFLDGTSRGCPKCLSADSYEPGSCGPTGGPNFDCSDQLTIDDCKYCCCNSIEEYCGVEFCPVASSPPPLPHATPPPGAAPPHPGGPSGRMHEICAALQGLRTSLQDSVASLATAPIACTPEFDGLPSGRLSFGFIPPVLGPQVGEMALAIDVDPCETAPSFRVLVSAAGHNQTLYNTTYGDRREQVDSGASVSYLGFNVRFYFDVAFSGTLDESVFTLGLSVCADDSGASSIGGPVGLCDGAICQDYFCPFKDIYPVFLTGPNNTDGIHFSVPYECPACEALYASIGRPLHLDSLPCAALYALIVTAAAVTLALLVGVLVAVVRSTRRWQHQKRRGSAWGADAALVVNEHQPDAWTSPLVPAWGRLASGQQQHATDEAGHPHGSSTGTMEGVSPSMLAAHDRAHAHMPPPSMLPRLQPPGRQAGQPHAQPGSAE